MGSVIRLTPLIPRIMIDREKQNLINDLVAALNGDAYQEAKEITERIRATKDENLIKTAEYINSVL